MCSDALTFDALGMSLLLIAGGRCEDYDRPSSGLEVKPLTAKVMDDSLEMTIGEVARRAGVATSSIRYYESIGLLREPDRVHGHRRYGAEVLGKLAFVDVAQQAGFKLEEIKELMRGAEGAAGMAAPMRELSDRKLDEIEALLERAQAMKQWLQMANTCDCRTPADCTLFPDAADAPADAGDVLRVVRVEGGTCRRR